MPQSFYDILGNPGLGAAACGLSMAIHSLSAVSLDSPRRPLLLGHYPKMPEAQSHLLHETPATLRNSRTCDHSCADNNQDATKHPGRREPFGVQDCTRDGSADQQPNGYDRETHAHPRANHGAVLRQVNEDCRRQRDEGSGEEAVQRTNNDQRCHGVCGDEAEDQNASDEGAGYNHVKRARAVGKEVRDDTTKYRSGVQDGEEVKGCVRVCNAGNGVGLDVEEENCGLWLALCSCVRYQ